jgi:phage shock protein B
MEKLMIVAIVFGSITLWVAIIPLTVVFIIKILRGGVSKKTPGMADEEARMIQEIYQGLSKMEKRVESLETLLLEKERKDKHP